MRLLYRFEGALEQAAPIGLVSDGLRLDVPFAGRIVAGELAGGRGWGVDYLVQRRDGVGVIDARDTFEIPGGHLHAQARGFVVTPDGVDAPSPTEMLDPGFSPADVRLAVNAYALCQTGVPAYEHLNRALVKVDGWVNMATGELFLEGREVGVTDTATVREVLADAR